MQFAGLQGTSELIDARGNRIEKRKLCAQTFLKTKVKRPMKNIPIEHAEASLKSIETGLEYLHSSYPLNSTEKFSIVCQSKGADGSDTGQGAIWQVERRGIYKHQHRHGRHGIYQQEEEERVFIYEGEILEFRPGHSLKMWPVPTARLSNHGCCRNCFWDCLCHTLCGAGLTHDYSIRHPRNWQTLSVEASTTTESSFVSIESEFTVLPTCSSVSGGLLCFWCYIEKPQPEERLAHYDSKLSAYIARLEQGLQGPARNTME